MESLANSKALRFSRRANCYEPLDQTYQKEGSESNNSGDDDRSISSWRTFSRRLMMRSGRQHSSRRHGGAAVAWSSLSYRRERARRRQVFLQSYKLETTSSLSLKSRSEKLRNMVVRVMKSALSRISKIKACNSKSAIRVVSPAQVIRCC